MRLFKIYIMYQLFNHIVLRTPAFSFNFRDDYIKVVDSDHFQEALYLASPSLYDDIYIQKRDDKRVLYPLIRYINRMATRCTPFGLFAGCSIGKLCVVPEKTSLVIQKEMQKHIRLDMSFLCKLSEILVKNKEIQEHVYFFSNSTLYKVGRKMRFIEKNARHSFQISSVENSSILKQVLKQARTGVRKKELLNFLIEQGMLEKDAMDYISDLIDSQILISEISPSVTGQDYFSKINIIIDREGITNKESLFVRQMNEKLKNLKQSSNSQSYRHFSSFLKSYGLSHDESHLFHVDMSRNILEIKMNKEVIKDLKKIIMCLCRNSLRNKFLHLQQFTKAFCDKYEQEEVSLLEVLDPEIGLGYPLSVDKNYLSPLLEGFHLPLENGKQISEIDLFYCKLSQKIIRAIALKKEVYLTDSDLCCNEVNSLDMPSIVGLMCELYQRENDNPQIYLKSIGGGCGNNLLARFAYMDSNIEDFVKEVADTEQLLNQDVIYAEISHLPEERVGNILRRQHIRDYEIILLTSSDLSEEKIIYLSDLSLSYKNGALCLKSKKLKKQICPRLTTAHNFVNSEVPIYRFLCDMQTQEPNIYFSLNQNLLLSQFGFLPRINYGNIILSLATWNISIEEIKHFFLIQDASMLMSELRCWRDTISMPQYCLLKDGDNTLYIDWNDFDIIQSLFSIIKKRENIYLSEFIFRDDSAVVRDEEGNPYLNEFIFIFKKKNNDSPENIYTRK